MSLDETLTETTPVETSSNATPAVDTSWTQQIPAEVAQDKLWERFKDKPLGEVLKSHVHAHRSLGAGLQRPKDDAPPEEWAAFWGKLGRPETVEGYQAVLPPLAEESGLTWDESGRTGFLKVAHEHGLTPGQVQGLLDWYAGYAAEGLDRQRQDTAGAIKAAATELEKEWGPRGGAMFKRNINKAVATVQKLFGGNERLLQLAEAEGNNPDWLRGLVAIYDQMQESGHIEGDIGPTDVAAIDARIQEVTQRLMKENLPQSQRQALIDERLNLYRQKPGGRKVLAEL